MVVDSVVVDSAVVDSAVVDSAGSVEFRHHSHYRYFQSLHTLQHPSSPKSFPLHNRTAHSHCHRYSHQRARAHLYIAYLDRRHPCTDRSRCPDRNVRQDSYARIHAAPHNIDNTIRDTTMIAIFILRYTAFHLMAHPLWWRWG